MSILDVGQSRQLTLPRKRQPHKKNSDKIPATAMSAKAVLK
jgi:hypothetical protein